MSQARLSRLIVCMECSSDREWEAYEYLEHIGKVKSTVVEPCGKHNRIVVYHVPASAEDLATMEASYS